MPESCKDRPLTWAVSYATPRLFRSMCAAQPCRCGDRDEVFRADDARCIVAKSGKDESGLCLKLPSPRGCAVRSPWRRPRGRARPRFAHLIGCGRQRVRSAVASAPNGQPACDRMLAQQLLVDYGTKGRIRIYADDVSAEAKQVEENMSSPTQLATNCLSRAKYKFDDYTGHILYTEDICYYYLAVNYDDLIREFWGDAAPSITIREPTARLERGTVPLRRRGRRPRYPWPDFAAELVRRSLYGPPIQNQAALERPMLDWCATSWSAEPAASEIREWVRSTFRILSGSSAAARAPNGIADDWSPDNAAVLDE
jgi:hypothetical protein